MAEWSLVQLEQVADVVGRGISPIYIEDDGVLVLNQKCVRGGRVLVAPARHHDALTRSIPSKKLLSGGEILINSTGVGTLGRTAFVGKVDGPMTADSHVTIVRAKSGFHPRWLGYAIRNLEPDIEALAIGSTGQTELGRSLVCGLPINVPPPAEQRAIAGVLGALDDKIESNRRVTATIEKLVPLIFQSMTAESELKLLPEVAKLQKGISYRSVDLEDSETAMVTLKSYDRNGGYKSNGLKPYIGKYKPEQVLLPGDIAVAQTDLTQGAEVVGRVIRIPSQEVFETLVASLDLVIVRPLDAADKTYLYGALLQEDFREHCRSRTSGTTVLHLGSDAIPKYSIPWADGGVRSAFADEVQPLLEEHDSLTKESTSLERLRDALLPELLSGRLRVKDAESMMENV